ARASPPGPGTALLLAALFLRRRRLAGRCSPLPSLLGFDPGVEPFVRFRACKLRSEPGVFAGEATDLRGIEPGSSCNGPLTLPRLDRAAQRGAHLPGVRFMGRLR